MGQDYTDFIITKMGDDIANAIRQGMQMRVQEKQYKQGSLQKMKDFMSLPPSKRQQLLQDPNFRQQMMDTIDPHLFGKHNEKKEGPRPSMESLLQLAKATPEEELNIDILNEEYKEALLKSKQGEQDLRTKTVTAEMAEMRKALSKGELQPTTLNVMLLGDLKDPLAAALAANLDEKTLTDLAMLEKKAGPLYQSQQKGEWFKWGLTEGFSPGMSMTYADAISNGRWDQLPAVDPITKKPVRGKAEQTLAIDMMNAQTSRLNAQNTIETSITTAAVALSEKSGLTLDQSRANVIAMRSGKPAPFPTPHLTWMVAFDEVIKQQEIKQNTETLLNDKAGIAQIRESMNTLLSQYKEGTGNAKLTEKQIVTLQTALTQRLSERYGMKFEEVGPGFWGSVGNAMSATWDAMKTSGAWADDVAADFDTMFHKLGTSSVQGIIVGLGSLSDPEGAQKLQEQFKQGATLTPAQESTLIQLYETADRTMRDPNATAEAKKKAAEYVRDVLETVRKDPSRFDRLTSAVTP